MSDETAPPESETAPIELPPGEPVKPVAAPEAVKEAPKVDTSNLPFVESLRKLLPSHEFENSVRMTKQGLFVEDRIVPQILDAYQRWIQSTVERAEKRSEEKVRRKLFGTDQRPTLYYVLDGRRCLPGFLLVGSVGDAQKLRITPYQANLLDTQNSLHPRDPILASQEHVKATLSPQDGFQLEFHGGGQRFVVDEAGLRGIVRNLRGEPGFLKEHPQLNSPLRETLGVVAEFLSRLKPFTGGQRLLIPDRLKQQRDVQLFRHRGFICLVEGEGRITGMYEVKGKGLGRFLREEISALTQPDGTNVVRGFDSKANKIQYLGKIWTHGMSFHLHLRAYRLFEREVQKSDAGPGRVGERYSVRDVVERIVSTFGRSQPVEELAILELLGKRRQPFAKYRRAKGWIFIVTDKNILFSCIRIAGEQLDAPRRNDGKPRERREGGPGRGGKGGGGRKHRGDRRGEGSGDRKGDRRHDGEKRGERKPPRGPGGPGGPGGGRDRRPGRGGGPANGPGAGRKGGAGTGGRS